MNKFSPGDKVVRVSEGICGGHGGMRTGDVDEVVACRPAAIDLKKYGDGHDPQYFKLVKPHVINTVNVNKLIDEMKPYRWNYNVTPMAQYFLPDFGLSEPTKKPLMNRVSNMMKKLLDADTQKLVKAGYINGDLDLTTNGREALMTLLFGTHKADLVKLAEEEIAEAEKNK